MANGRMNVKPDYSKRLVILGQSLSFQTVSSSVSVKAQMIFQHSMQSVSFSILDQQ